MLSSAPCAIMKSQVTSRSRSRTFRPNRGTTITRRTLGAPSTAASAVSFIGITCPRRRKPSAVMSTLASQYRGVQLAVGESPRRALLALEDDRRARRIVAQCRCDEVHSAAEPPGGPGDAAGRIVHAVVRLLPNQSEVTLHCAPEALQIFDGPPVQRGKVLVAVGRGELTQPAAREVALGGGPGERHSNEPSFGVVL